MGHKKCAVNYCRWKTELSWC